MVRHPIESCTRSIERNFEALLYNVGMMKKTQVPCCWSSRVTKQGYGIVLAQMLPSPFQKRLPHQGPKFPHERLVYTKRKSCHDSLDKTLPNRPPWMEQTVLVLLSQRQPLHRKLRRHGGLLSNSFKRTKQTRRSHEALFVALCPGQISQNSDKKLSPLSAPPQPRRSQIRPYRPSLPRRNRD